MSIVQNSHKILILGGGFGGVIAAKRLAALGLEQVKISLISDTSYLQYYGSLYRLASGGSTAEACILLTDMLEGTGIDIIKDRISRINAPGKSVCGESGLQYRYDSLIIAVGSDASYFGIPGVAKRSYSLRGANEALRLKRHIHEVFDAAKGLPPADQVPSTRICIVGGGPAGVELSGELAGYARHLAKQHGINPNIVVIDVIEAMQRIMPMLSEDASARLTSRLQELGVNVMVGRSLLKEDVDALILKDMHVQTKTVVWTAGVKGNKLLETVAGAELDKRGRLTVDKHLRAKGAEGVFVIGDAASTQYSGMAQTAVRDGAFVAEVLRAQFKNDPLPIYIPKQPVCALPVGPNWAIIAFKDIAIYGYLGWMIRRAADLKVYFMLLPFRKALRTWISGGETVESCETCKSE